MIVAVCLLLTGALFGIYMFIRHLRRTALPKWAAILHGAFGATGFGVVLFMMVRNPGMAFARDAIMILIGAIVLGAVNLVFHLRRVRHRTTLIILHALTAVAGVLMLVYGIVTGADARASAPLPGPMATATTTGSEAPAAASAPPVASTASAAALAAVPGASDASAPSAPSTPTTAAAATVAALHPGAAWTERPVLFEGSSATLDTGARAALTEVAKDLRAHPEVTLVEVQGHADERGDKALNLQLTSVRAAAAVDFLVSQGIARARLRSVGYGVRCPADPECQKQPAPASCHQPSSWQNDRRVSLVVIEAAGERLKGKATCDRAPSP
ncbi:MAG: Flagellar motor rotation protein MotB [Labilithrix sp.]|nr:Flagellar motor rotation protein MotB [Labilithrix sp.]